MKELLRLFAVFAKIGAVTFGGGYAMLPILQREIVDKNKWATEEELLDYYAIGQCTPGVIAVNTATFIGHKRKGIAGGVVATLGVVFPSIVIISILAAFISNFSEYAVVRHAMNGIRICVCVLVLSAVINLWKKAVKDKWAFMIFALCFMVAVFLPQVQTAVLVVFAGVLGYVICALKTKTKKEKQD